MRCAQIAPDMPTTRSGRIQTSRPSSNERITSNSSGLHRVGSNNEDSDDDNMDYEPAIEDSDVMEYFESLDDDEEGEEEEEEEYHGEPRIIQMPELMITDSTKMPTWETKRQPRMERIR